MGQKQGKATAIERKQPAVISIRRGNNKTTNIIDFKSDFPLYGVSLKHLRSLKIDPSWNCYQVCNEFVIKQTQDCKISYAQLLYDNVNTRHCVASKADVFVSYAWAYNFTDLLRALEPLDDNNNNNKKKNVKSKENDIFVWLDMVIVNQHNAGTKDLNAWLNTFSSALKHIGMVKLVVMPWKEPIPSKRSWCVFEHFVTVSNNIDFETVLSQKEVEDFISHMRERKADYKFFEKLLGNVNCEAANAYKREDQEAIQEKIRMEGPAKVNDIIMVPLKQWLVTNAPKSVVPNGDAKSNANAWYCRAALHSVLAEYTSAIECTTKAMELYENAEGADSENVRMCLSDLGKLYTDTGDNEKALEILNEVLQRDNDEVARSNMAVALQNLGRYEEAVDALVPLLDLFPDAYDYCATVRHNLADLYQRLGQNDRALELYQAAFEYDLKFANGNRNHPNVAGDLYALGKFYLDLGDYDQATKYHQEALDIRVKLYGPVHDTVGQSLVSIGLIHKNTNNLDLAVETLEKGLDVLAKVHGAENQKIGMVWSNLGTVYESKNDLKKARECLEKSVTITEKTLGRNHPSMAIALSNLGSVVKNQGDFDGAMALFQEALSIDQVTFGKDHPDCAVRLYNMSATYCAFGRKEEGRALGEQARSIWTKTYGPDHPFTKAAISLWGPA